MSPDVLLPSKVSLQNWSHVNTFSSISVEINEVSQYAISQQQNDNQTLDINCINFSFLDKVADNETNTHTWNVAASSVEELNWLSPDEFVWFLVNLLTVFTCIAIRDACHVDVRVNVCSDHTAQETQKWVKDQVAAWSNFVASSIWIASQWLKYEINEVEKCVQERSTNYSTQVIFNHACECETKALFWLL